MATYQVKQGMRFGGANQYGPTDKIELSVEEAAGFLDKLDLVASTSSADDASTSSADEGTGSAVDGWNGLDPKVVTLLEAAEVTPATVPTLTDEELLAIDGVGAKTIEKIRSALRGNTE